MRIGTEYALMGNFGILTSLEPNIRISPHDSFHWISKEL